VDVLLIKLSVVFNLWLNDASGIGIRFLPPQSGTFAIKVKAKIWIGFGLSTTKLGWSMREKHELPFFFNSISLFLTAIVTKKELK